MADTSHAVLARCLETAMTAMTSSADLPKLRLAAATEGMSCPMQIAATAAGRELLALFANAGLPAVLGFNAGSRELTVTVRLAVITAAAREGPAAAAKWHPAKNLLWLALGVHPLQSELEKLHGGSGAELANGCLSAFARATHAAFTAKKVHLRLQTITMAIEPARKGLIDPRGRECADSKTPLFKYAPAYLALSGRTLSSSVRDTSYTQAALDDALDAVVADGFVDQFWAAMEHARYVATPWLREAISNDLWAYGRSAAEAGVYGDQSARFVPKRPISFYLWGAAGAGKSAFVTAFASSMVSAVAAALNPTEEVSVVKIPLNSMSPEALKSELYVRGISDWSIERVMEQAISRGSTVVLHLEENPEDATEQAELAELVFMVLGRVRQRYPKSAHKIIPIWTANYPPLVPAIIETTNTVSMSALMAAHQQKMCELKLEHAVNEQTIHVGHKMVALDLALEVVPPVTTDLRPIEKWIACVAHQTVRAYCSLLKNTSKCLRRRPGSVDSGFDGSESSSASSGDEEIEATLTGAPVSPATAVRISGDADGGHYTIEVKLSSGASHTVQLRSDDGFFCYPEPEIAISTTDTELQNALGADGAVQIQTMTGMLETHSLTPAVLVLCGAAGRTKAAVAAVSRYLKTRHPDDVFATEVQLRREADQAAVIGNKWDFPRGGLYKFIDDVNNVTGDFRRDRPAYALITAKVNDYGQYVLREMLEGNKSQTHRQTVSKDRVMFVVVADEGSELSPMTVSRSHVILNL